MMGPMAVQDLPRYHSFVKNFGEIANHWIATGHLRGLVNVWDGYILDLSIPLSGEEGDILLGQMDSANSNDDDEEL